MLLSPDNLHVTNTGEFQAQLIAINKKQAAVVLQKLIECNKESPIQIHLGQAISRGDKMDFTIQKATELGVSSITPLFTEYCNVKLTKLRLDKKEQHWQNVAISAAEQSGRCYVPKILPTKTLASWNSTIKTDSLRLAFSPQATSTIKNIHNVFNNFTILIGPEGGISREERELLYQQQFLLLSLGPRILRTETAALTVISILQAKWGDMI